jgi:post-segregation antitoxin (ccd killing protein)
MKSVSEKGFLKNEAIKAINSIPSISNPAVTEELMNLTKSANGNISELAIKTINLMLEKNKETDVSEKFLKDLSYNINGKRSVVQKQAKEILDGLKKRVGEEKLEKIIDQAS